MFGRDWNRVDAKLIDQRYLEGGQVDAGGQRRYELWQYMVEAPGEDGNPVHLTIKEKSFKLKLPAIGGPVPILVNPKWTKAKFDFSDPSIDAVQLNKSRAKAEKDADAARFEANLADPGSKASRSRQKVERAEAEASRAIEEGDDLRALEAMEAAEEARGE